MPQQITPGTQPSIPFLRPKDRLTVVETLSHETTGGEPTGIWTGFSRTLITEEQVWERRDKVAEEWIPLDCGWFKGAKCSQLLIRNEEGTNLTVNPSVFEQALIKSKIIEVCFRASETPLKADCLIHPGESLRVMPSELNAIRLRCGGGKASIIINIFPL